MMKETGLLLIVLTAFFGCKSAGTAITGSQSAEKGNSAASIIANHYKNRHDFKTAYIKASAKYKDEKQSQSVTAEIKIKKDEAILISIRFLGITMAKALITPDKVQYYEKINSNYFEGDYAALSQWLGTDLNFGKAQNLLIGEAMDDLAKGGYTAIYEGNLYKLQNASDDETKKEYYLAANNYFLKKLIITQSDRERLLQAQYPDYRQYGAQVLPSGIDIDASQAKGKTTIDIQYNSATFDEDLSFPYSVPEGYERVYIR